MAMSCKAIDAELTGLYAQFEEINKAERARERKAGLTSGLLSAGISFAGISALGNAGSVQAMQNIGTATSVASTAASASKALVDPTLKPSTKPPLSRNAVPFWNAPNSQKVADMPHRLLPRPAALCLAAMRSRAHPSPAA